MIEKITLLYQNNKLLFFVFLIPLVLLLVMALFLPMARTFLLNSATKLINLTVKKDVKLSAEADALNAEANAHKQNSDNLKTKIAENNANDDADWHKKD